MVVTIVARRAAVAVHGQAGLRRRVERIAGLRVSSGSWRGWSVDAGGGGGCDGGRRGRGGCGGRGRLGGVAASRGVVGFRGIDAAVGMGWSPRRRGGGR